MGAIAALMLGDAFDIFLVSAFIVAIVIAGHKKGDDT